MCTWSRAHENMLEFQNLEIKLDNCWNQILELNLIMHAMAEQQTMLAQKSLKIRKNTSVKIRNEI